MTKIYLVKVQSRESFNPVNYHIKAGGVTQAAQRTQPFMKSRDEIVHVERIAYSDN